MVMKDPLKSVLPLENSVLTKRAEWSVSADPRQAPFVHKMTNPPAGYQHDILWQEIQQYREFICGWGAAFINISTTFPLNKIMFRQQLHGISMRKAIRQLQKEGFLTLYRGLVPPLLQKTTSLSIMFGLYGQFQHTIANHMTSLPHGHRVNKAAAAMCAGTVEAILTPFERIQALLQDKHYQGHFRNTYHAFRELQPHGIQEYYRGLTPILLRNGPSNVMFFLLRGEIKSMFPKSDSAYVNTAQNFASGGVLGAFISTIFFPVNVVKTHMQTKLGQEFMRFHTAFWIVFEERKYSWKKMFRGMHVNYTRSLISWGIINASYELLKTNLFPDCSD